VGRGLPGGSGRLERKEVPEVITDDKMAELVNRTQGIMAAGMSRAYPLPEREFVASPVAAVVLANLVQEENYRSAQVPYARASLAATYTALKSEAASGE
jgi:hypothetical protein